ncbi:hypothetical protein NDU88_003442 [Pleurodeles waltl]|uniref:Uncharacterized protein n=1 Tax=Pleurodeles waltl TaxID=8319 RepID=A0AAV7V2E2_PLEWA|nr:hypothetical protein NDU88_003442 [Pleurodeles waltl]
MAARIGPPIMPRTVASIPRSSAPDGGGGEEAGRDWCRDQACGSLSVLEGAAVAAIEEGSPGCRRSFPRAPGTGSAEVAAPGPEAGLVPLKQSAADHLGSTATLCVRSGPTVLRRELPGAHREPGSRRPQERAAAAVLSAPSPGGTRDHRHTSCGAGRPCALGVHAFTPTQRLVPAAQAPKPAAAPPPPLQRRDRRLATTPRLHMGPVRPNLPQLGHKGGSHTAPADSLVCWRPALRISAWDGDALQEGTR